MSQVFLIKVPITKRQSSVGVMVQGSSKLSLLTLRPVDQPPASSPDELIKTSSKPDLIPYHTVIATLIAVVKGKGSDMCHRVTALTHIPSVFVCVWRWFDKPQCESCEKHNEFRVICQFFSLSGSVFNDCSV